MPINIHMYKAKKFKKKKEVYLSQKIKKCLQNKLYIYKKKSTNNNHDVVAFIILLLPII